MKKVENHGFCAGMYNVDRSLISFPHWSFELLLEERGRPLKRGEERGRLFGKKGKLWKRRKSRWKRGEGSRKKGEGPWKRGEGRMKRGEGP